MSAMDEALKTVRAAAVMEALNDMYLMRNFTFQGLNANQLTAVIDHYEASTGKAASELHSTARVAKRFEDDPGTR